MLKKIVKAAAWVVGVIAALIIASKLWFMGALYCWTTFGYPGLVWFVGATCVVLVVGMVLL